MKNDFFRRYRKEGSYCAEISLTLINKDERLKDVGCNTLNIKVNR